jgi:hypothetical protein
MAAKKQNIISILEEAKTRKQFRSAMDDFLDENPELKKELKEIIGWFAENKSKVFGWKSLHDTMTSLDRWKDIPVSYRALQSYAMRSDDRFGD